MNSVFKIIIYAAFFGGAIHAQGAKLKQSEEGKKKPLSIQEKERRRQEWISDPKNKVIGLKVTNPGLNVTVHTVISDYMVRGTSSIGSYTRLAFSSLKGAAVKSFLKNPRNDPDVLSNTTRYTAVRDAILQAVRNIFNALDDIENLLDEEIKIKETEEWHEMTVQITSIYGEKEEYPYYAVKREEESPCYFVNGPDIFNRGMLEEKEKNNSALENWGNVRDSLEMSSENGNLKPCKDNQSQNYVPPRRPEGSDWKGFPLSSWGQPSFFSPDEALNLCGSNVEKSGKNPDHKP